MRPYLRRAATWASATALGVTACSGADEDSNSGDPGASAEITATTGVRTQDPTAATTARALALPDPPGELIDVDGHLMHLFCIGEGDPTVLLEAGLGDSSLGFSAVQEQLAATTRVCSYDRAGLGWSEPSPEPRTGQHIVSELEALLDGAGEHGPYVLAGHSLGGPLVLIFAQQNLEDVEGVVLIDASHPRQEQVYADHFPQVDAAYGEYRAQHEAIAARVETGELDVGDVIPLTPASLPLRAREQMAALMLVPHMWETLKAEEKALAQTLAEVGGKGSLGDVPLVVLVAGLGLDGEMSAHVQQQFGVTDEDVLRFDAIWRNLQEDYLTWSTNSWLVLAESSAHYIHHDEEELVVDAILGLFDTR